MSPRADSAVKRAIDNAVALGTETGVQVAAYLKGELVVDTWGGVADEVTGRKVDGDTLFNVYSVTKAVAAVALHIQADRGLIDYNAPVTRYWPDPERTAVTERRPDPERAAVPAGGPAAERQAGRLTTVRAIGGSRTAPRAGTDPPES